MASAMIHIAVASEINKTINKDRNKLLIGSIAPDLAKIVGDTKERSHFILKQYTNIPEIDLFLKKYKKHLDDDFVLGYYIHLYTDYLWFKYFIPEIYSYNLIKKLDGSIVRCTQGQMMKYIYSDYTNLNTRLLDEYDLDLKIFYNDVPDIENIIQEVRMDKLNLLLDKTSLIIENAKERKEYVFDIENIKQFINTASKLILAKIDELGVNYLQ
jgi:hypothetical protein